jgi:hypothetical protein
MDNTIKTIIVSNLEKYEKLSKILKYLFVDLAQIDQHKYFIFGSYTIRKYRKINDLDTMLDDKEFMKLEKLTKMNIGQLDFFNGDIRWYYDMTNDYNNLTNSTETDFSVEAFSKNKADGFPNKNFSMDNLNKNNGLDKDENGHQMFSLKSALEWKKSMNRPKDQADIQIIENLLNNKPMSRTKRVSKKKVSKKKVSKKKVSKKKSKKTSKKIIKKISKKKN